MVWLYSCQFSPIPVSCFDAIVSDVFRYGFYVEFSNLLAGQAGRPSFAVQLRVLVLEVTCVLFDQPRTGCGRVDAQGGHLLELELHEAQVSL